MELQESLAEYQRNDIAVFAVSYDSVSVLAGFAEKYGIEYPLLADEGSVVIRQLGMLNDRVAEHHAFYGVPMRDDVYGVPYPGTFVLDEDGIVVERRFEDSYRVRQTAVGVLEAAFGAHSGRHGAESRAAGDGVAALAYLDSRTYRVMQQLRLTVQLQIESGLHLYGQPIPDGYVPLSVEVAPIDGLEVGAMEAPAPELFVVAGLDEQFFVYTDAVTLTVPLSFGQTNGEKAIEVVVRYQACSASECLVPGALRFALPLTYLPHVERPT